jgi:hypothetical protein
MAHLLRPVPAWMRRAHQMLAAVSAAVSDPGTPSDAKAGAVRRVYRPGAPTLPGAAQEQVRWAELSRRSSSGPRWPQFRGPPRPVETSSFTERRTTGASWWRRLYWMQRTTDSTLPALWCLWCGDRPACRWEAKAHDGSYEGIPQRGPALRVKRGFRRPCWRGGRVRSRSRSRCPGPSSGSSWSGRPAGGRARAGNGGHWWARWEPASAG